jgi:glucose-1-phosphatase
MKNIKNIIFDYGNVIFLIDFKRTQHTFTELGIENVERFFAHTGHDRLFDEFEKGLITAPQFRDGIRRITGKPELEDTQIDKAWNTLLIGVPPVNHRILLNAKKRYRTFLLSNNNEIHYTWIMSYLKSEYNINSNEVFFEKDYYSHLLKMRKPDNDIFELVIRENNLVVEETLFIDDSPQHIRTAQNLGLVTHLLTAPETLESFMYSSGLLAKEESKVL